MCYSNNPFLISILAIYVYVQDSTLDYDYADDDTFPFPVGEFGGCSSDHGTCCAGEIAMIKSNGLCGVGVAYQSTIVGKYTHLLTC